MDSHNAAPDDGSKPRKTVRPGSQRSPRHGVQGLKRRQRSIYGASGRSRQCPHSKTAIVSTVKRVLEKDAG